MSQSVFVDASVTISRLWSKRQQPLILDLCKTRLNKIELDEWSFDLIKKILLIES